MKCLILDRISKSLFIHTYLVFTNCKCKLVLHQATWPSGHAHATAFSCGIRVRPAFDTQRGHLNFTFIPRKPQITEYILQFAVLVD